MKKEYFKKIEFKNHKLGLYDMKTFVKDWENKPRRGIKEKRCRIVKKGREKVLEITIPKGTTSKGGSFWRLNFPRAFTDATFEYDIMFGESFNFVRGGKLPGLGGGASMGSKGTPEQYRNGFSARLMWREINFENELSLKKPIKKELKTLKEMIKSEKKEEAFSQITNIKNELIKLGWNFRDLVKEPHKAFLVQYMYYPDKKGRFGENLAYEYGEKKDKKVFIEPNKWYNIKMRIRLSENSKKQDTILAWVDGKKVLNKKRNLRKNKSYGINQVMFSLFFGGEDETWATKEKEKVYFKKIVVRGK
jgi:hypothetical protein